MTKPRGCAILDKNKHTARSGEKTVIYMAKGFFNHENTAWRWIGRIPELLLLSLLWALLSLPVVTLIPATAALYDAVARNVVPDVKGAYHRFFRTFKNELGRGLLMSLLWLPIAAVVILGGKILETPAQDSNLWAGFTLVYQILSLLPLGAFIWTVTLESRFVYPFWTLHKNALIFMISYLPRTALILLLMILAFVICWCIPLLTLVMPAVLMALLTIPIEKVFQQYMPREAE